MKHGAMALLIGLLSLGFAPGADAASLIDFQGYSYEIGGFPPSPAVGWSREDSPVDAGPVSSCSWLDNKRSTAPATSLRLATTVDKRESLIAECSTLSLPPAELSATSSTSRRSITTSVERMTRYSACTVQRFSGRSGRPSWPPRVTLVCLAC